jgi:oligopeptide/dipeptide ABC transporter ATP-binding protein
LTTPALEVSDLAVEFYVAGGTVHAVRGVTFQVQPGETLAIVGESGCGKSTAVQAVMGLLPAGSGCIVSGSARLDGEELIGMRGPKLNRILGAKVGMIFQDPMISLNPTMRVGEQIAEALIVHQGVSPAAAKLRAVQLLEKMRVPDAATRARQYPFEFSGGMAQRAMIAASVICSPQLLIADEPTTALDVTIQDEVLQLLEELQREAGMAIVLITHDLGVVARMADKVVVMYAGQVVESGSIEDIYYRSAHPYTVGLKNAVPAHGGQRRIRLAAIDGNPPNLMHPPRGCGYVDRCPLAMTICASRMPDLIDTGPGHAARCWLQHPGAPPSANVHQAHFA